jgi:hypothetical protein
VGRASRRRAERRSAVDAPRGSQVPAPSTTPELWACAASSTRTRDEPVAEPTQPSLSRGRRPLGDRAAHLVRLAELDAERRELDAELTLLVRQLAAAGISWAAIGRALGISRQGARQRYG